MSDRMAFWGIYVNPGETYTLEPDADGRRLRISQATLGEQCDSDMPRSVLQCAVGNGPPISICSLSVEDKQCRHLHLEFEEFEDVVFSVIGPRGVHLVGYYLAQCPTCRTTDNGTDNYMIKYYNEGNLVEAENEKDKKLITSEEGNEKKMEGAEVKNDKKLSTTEEEIQKDKMPGASEENILDTDSFVNSNGSGENCYDLSDSFIDDSGLSMSHSMQKFIGIAVNGKTVEDDKSNIWSSCKRNQSTEINGDSSSRKKRRTAKTAPSAAGKETDCKQGSRETVKSGSKGKLADVMIRGESKSEPSAENFIKTKKKCSLKDVKFSKGVEAIAEKNEIQNGNEHETIPDINKIHHQRLTGSGEVYEKSDLEAQCQSKEMKSQKKKKKNITTKGKEAKSEEHKAALSKGCSEVYEKSDLEAQKCQTEEMKSPKKKEKKITTKEKEVNSEVHKSALSREGCNEDYEKSDLEAQKCQSEEMKSQKKKKKITTKGKEENSDEHEAALSKGCSEGYEKSDLEANKCQTEEMKSQKKKKKKITKEKEVNSEEHKASLSKEGRYEDYEKSELEAQKCKSKEMKSQKKKKKNITTKEKEANLEEHKAASPEDGKKSIKSLEDKNVGTETSQARALLTGIIIEDLEKGKPDGNIAAPGSRVKIMYTARLKETGDIIDSNIGHAPVKFLLGDEEIIKGWNLGIEGMRVGDKRRLILSPSMSSWKTFSLNSWVVYDVELVGVR